MGTDFIINFNNKKNWGNFENFVPLVQIWLFLLFKWNSNTCQILRKLQKLKEKTLIGDHLNSYSTNGCGSWGHVVHSIHMICFSPFSREWRKEQFCLEWFIIIVSGR